MGYRDNDRCLAKVAADEPIFVLRSQDESAPDVVRYWLDQQVSLTEEHRQEAEGIIRQMLRWQDANIDRVKAAD